MGEDEESDSDEEDEYDGCEETSLEAYTTPLDEDDCDVDEYNIFKQVIFLSNRIIWYTFFSLRRGYRCMFRCLAASKAPTLPGMANSLVILPRSVTVFQAML